MGDKVKQYQLALEELRKITGNIKDPQMGELYEVFSEEHGRDMISLYASPTKSGMRYTWGVTDRWGHDPAFSISGNKRNYAKRSLKNHPEGMSEQEAAYQLYGYRKSTGPSTMEKVMKYLKEVF